MLYHLLGVLIMKKLKKPVSILLTFVMVFGLFASIPFYVSAAEEIIYLECSWDGSRVVKTKKICTDYTKINDDTQETNLTEGWYYLDTQAKVQQRLMVQSGTVNMIVDIGVKLRGGIGVAPGATLNLYRVMNGNEDYGELDIEFDKTEDNKNNAAIGGTNGNAGTINNPGSRGCLYFNVASIDGN